jgi:hypothetical protein
MYTRHHPSYLTVLLSTLFLFTPLYACPFCAATGTTLTAEAAQAQFIVFGKLSNPRLDPGEFSIGQTDVELEAIVKDHEYLKGRKTITIPRYIPLNRKTPTKYLVYCDLFQGRLDPYRGFEVLPDSKIADYLKGALALKDKDIKTRLEFFYRYLDAADVEISNDAYNEFALADYADYRPIAEKADPDAVAKWLTDPSTPANRFGLYGSLLGHCGQAKHADTLRAVLNDPKRKFGSGMDGVLAGWVLVDRQAGWQYLADLLRDPKSDLLLRHAGLRTVDFLWAIRPDVVPQDKLLAGVLPVLEQPDIGDLVVDKLRKWQSWEHTERVLALTNDPKLSDISLLTRALTRFCLSVPAKEAGHKTAQAFVAKLRAKKPDIVEDAEEALKQEASRTPVK